MTKLRKVGNKLCRDGAKIQTVECGCGPSEPGIDCSWQTGSPSPFFPSTWNCCGDPGGSTAPYAAYRNLFHPDNPDGRFEITRRLAASAGVRFEFFPPPPLGFGGSLGLEPPNPVLDVSSWGNAQFMDPNPTTCDTGVVTHWRPDFPSWPTMVVPIAGEYEWFIPQQPGLPPTKRRKRFAVSFELQGQIDASVTNSWSLIIRARAWKQEQWAYQTEQYEPGDDQYDPDGWQPLANAFDLGRSPENMLWDVIAELDVQVVGTGFPVEGSDLGSITYDTFPQLNEPLFGLERFGNISPSIVNWLGLFGGVEVIWDYTEVHEFLFNQYGAIKTGRFYGNGSLKQFFCPCNVGTQSLIDPRILDRLNRQANGGGCQGCGDGNTF